MKKLFYGLALIVIASSCLSNKKILYIQDEDLSTEKPKEYKNRRSDYPLQPNDIINVRIFSSESESVDQFSIEQNIQMGAGGADAMLYTNGYIINPEGLITMPLIGSVPVAGLTITQVQKKIQEEVDAYYSDATVIVKLFSYRISILGEVRTPNTYRVFADQINILQAISMAGDFTDFANRKSVRLIRQRADGGVEAIILDLTNPKILESEYFYLLPNDVLIADPVKAQARRVNLPLITTVFSGISTIILVLNVFLN